MTRTPNIRHHVVVNAGIERAYAVMTGCLRVLDVKSRTEAVVTVNKLGWKIPERRSPDFYSLSLACHLLFEGESARLYQKLVKGEESVVQIQGGIDERRGPSGLFIVVIPKPDSEGGQIRDAILAEIGNLATDGPSANVGHQSLAVGSAGARSASGDAARDRHAVGRWPVQDRALSAG